MADYVTKEQLQAFAEAGEDTSDEIWEQLASAVSRMFERATEVTEDFYAVASEEAVWKTFRGGNTVYLAVPPFVAPISEIKIDDEAVEVDGDDYYEDGVFLVFNYQLSKSSVIEVKAKFGFAAVPSDVVQACIEQALFMWRRKDTAFTEIAGVSSAVVQAEYSPTFKAVTDRYREKYSQNTFFS